MKSGARTRLTGIFHALGLLVFMFILGPVMARIPLSALAGGSDGDRLPYE
ncbi:MAG: SulP family inorganic anion transporter [Eisenbergiella massiliensis]